MQKHTKRQVKKVISNDAFISGACHRWLCVILIRQNPFWAALHDPGLDTDPGQLSVEFYVCTSPGWVTVGSFSDGPGQFLFHPVERAGNYLSVRKMADEPCNHQNHQLVLTLPAILPMLL